MTLDEDVADVRTAGREAQDPIKQLPDRGGWLIFTGKNRSGNCRVSTLQIVVASPFHRNRLRKCVKLWKKKHCGRRD